MDATAELDPHAIASLSSRVEVTWTERSYPCAPLVTEAFRRAFP